MAAQLKHIPRRCERSVVTAYQELKLVGIDELQIFESCINLYRIYHPESSLTEARLLVSEWIDYHIYDKHRNAPKGCDCDE
ncbi:hypothetical protein COMNV_00307 [Commensalibacter sp. Nvir]|uniref:hypothetical protein n=1 Tax=Commensalibacter sp. Nvir TaxID=3069817 RepID=UPI002D50D5A6|nr:hypothetical protein COMNV_00307 [Commensalibacter sp. Nvir]